jgi:hypothetical protein
MSARTRFIPARVVGPVEFAGETDVSGPRKPLSPRKRKIRAKLQKAFRLKKRITHLKIRQPLGWKGAVANLKKELRVVMADLRQLGWKPKKPRRSLKPGEDEMDAALDDLPENEPTENDEDLEELPDAPDGADLAEGELGNWLDGYVGVDPPAPAKKPKKNLFEEAGKLFRPAWSKHVPLGDAARIQTKSGQRAMVATVRPGLFIVQVVSDQAVKKIAGDNVGILPLVLYPLVKDQVQKALGPKPAPAQPAAPAPAAAPAIPAPAPAAAGIGCDCPKRS